MIHFLILSVSLNYVDYVKWRICRVNAWAPSKKVSSVSLNMMSKIVDIMFLRVFMTCIELKANPSSAKAFIMRQIFNHLCKETLELLVRCFKFRVL